MLTAADQPTNRPWIATPLTVGAALPRRAELDADTAEQICLAIVVAIAVSAPTPATVPRIFATVAVVGRNEQAATAACWIALMVALMSVVAVVVPVVPDVEAQPPRATAIDSDDAIKIFRRFFMINYSFVVK